MGSILDPTQRRRPRGNTHVVARLGAATDDIAAGVLGQPRLSCLPSLGSDGINAVALLLERELAQAHARHQGITTASRVVVARTKGQRCRTIVEWGRGTYGLVCRDS